jgi:hypothetical protein
MPTVLDDDGRATSRATAVLRLGPVRRWRLSRGPARRLGRAMLPFLLVPALLLGQTDPAGAAAGRGVHVPRGAYLGAWIRPANWSFDGWRHAVTGFESQIHHRLDIVQYYYGWKGWFPTRRERWEVRNHRIPLISWDGVNTDAIRRGSYDGLIRSRATAVRKLGRPVFIRWNWEMDRGGPTIPSPASFIAAWRRIASIFRQRGALNATFVWCPTAYGFVSGDAQRYWPGRRYVGWVCADGYNWYPGRRSARWVSFQHVFRRAYAFAQRVNRPMMVGEMGVQEDRSHPGRKAAWLRGARRTVKAVYRRIKAVVYFNADRVYDWRLGTSRSATLAFARMARDRYFNRV